MCQMRKGTLLRLIQITHHRARGNDSGRIIMQPQPVKGGYMKMFLQAALAGVLRKLPILKRSYRCGQTFLKLAGARAAG